MNYPDTIWDCHAHLFTEAMAQDPRSWAQKNNEPVWADCVAPPNRPSIQGWASPDQLLKDMDDANIETVILQGWYWETATSCRVQNQFYAELLRQHPDRIRAFATLQPTAPEIRSELKWIRDQGFIGIGEIHPQAQGFSLEDDCWSAVMETIRGWDMVINFHVTDPDTPDHSGKVETPLPNYLTLATEWPDQDFILSHLGALIPLREEHREQAIPLSNLYYDCAAVPLLYNASIIAKLSQVVGTDRLLFGSDYPLRVIPKLQKTPDFTHSIEFVRESGLTEEQLGLLFSTNAKRLFRV